jgi:hypothetical protein
LNFSVDITCTYNAISCAKRAASPRYWTRLAAQGLSVELQGRTFKKEAVTMATKKKAAKKTAKKKK